MPCIGEGTFVMYLGQEVHWLDSRFWSYVWLVWMILVTKAVDWAVDWVPSLLVHYCVTDQRQVTLWVVKDSYVKYWAFEWKMFNCRKCCHRASLIKYINIFVPSLLLCETKCNRCFVPGTDQKDLRNISAFLHCCFYFHQQYPTVDLLMIEYAFTEVWNLAVLNTTVNWYFTDSLSFSYVWFSCNY